MTQVSEKLGITHHEELFEWQHLICFQMLREQGQRPENFDGGGKPAYSEPSLLCYMFLNCSSAACIKSSAEQCSMVSVELASSSMRMILILFPPASIFPKKTVSG